MEVTNDRDRRLEASAANAAPPTPRSSTADASERAARYPSDAVLSDLHERVPSSIDYSFLKPVHQPAPGATEVSGVRRKATNTEIMQGRLDDFRDRFSGPYRVDGQSVRARPMFRMNTADAFNRELLQRNLPALRAACTKAGLANEMNLCIAGRGSPEQLVRVTQALLDANRLPPADSKHTTVESRIRLMQWQHGIGVDCAGYTQQAAAFAHGAEGRVFAQNLMGDVFTNMRNDRRFVDIDPEDIRPGDVIHLDHPKRAQGAVGHNVIVRDHSQITAGELARIPAIGPGVAEYSEATRQFLASSGPFHRYTVDSSWGAGEEGNDYGGYRRDTWIYDASSGRWATLTPEAPRLLYCDPRGPQGEIFAGAFRPASEMPR